MGLSKPRIESSSRGQATKRFPSILLPTLVLCVKRHFISLLCICLSLSAGLPGCLCASLVYPWMVGEGGPWNSSYPGSRAL